MYKARSSMCAGVLVRALARGFLRLLPILSMALLWLPAEARAGGSAALCPLVDSGYITTDGLLDDWKQIRFARVGAGPDASMRVRCAYDADQLFISLDVLDQRLIRTRRARASAEDHIEVRLGGRDAPLRFRLLPGSPTARPSLKVAGRRPRWLRVEDSLQPRGFSVEIELPRARLRGIGKRTPAIPVEIVFHDTDKATAHRIQQRRGFDGYLHTEAGFRTYRTFLSTLELPRKSIVFDRLADVDTAPGAERVIVAGVRQGVVVAVLSESFAFMQLPVRSLRDLKSVKLVDFDGDGRSFLVTQVRQGGAGGSRELVSVWELKGDGSWRPVVGFEVAKRLGAASVESNWQLVPRAAVRKRGRREPRKGYDILVRAGAAKGFDESNWNEIAATDVHPILLPWADQKVAVYRFDGNVAQKVDPDPRRLRRWLKKRARRDRRRP